MSGENTEVFNETLSTWSCLEIRMQDEGTIKRLIINSSFERVEQFTYLGKNLNESKFCSGRN
jgi:hypothetical protein